MNLPRRFLPARFLAVSIALAVISTLGASTTTRPVIEPGFVPIFNGRDLDGWQGLGGDTSSYSVQDGLLVCSETGKVHLFTVKEYADFILRLEIKLDPGGNNGIGIRTKVSKQPHLEGCEIQVLDDPYYARGIPRAGKEPKDWVKLKDYQHHGSIYGVVPAKPGHLKPAGEWNQQEIACIGRRVTVTLNGVVIVDANLAAVKPIDGLVHPGLHYTKGHIGLHAHGNYGARVYFRNLRIKELPAAAAR
jgi:hypothetical protein